MGYVYAEIELINGEDAMDQFRGMKASHEVKRLFVPMRIDTRSAMLCINERIRDMLQIPAVDKRKVQTGEGEIIECDVVAPVEVRYRNRRGTCRAVVLPEDSEPVFGRIPFIDMDVMVDARLRELIEHPDRPDGAQLKVKVRRPYFEYAEHWFAGDEIDSGAMRRPAG